MKKDVSILWVLTAVVSTIALVAGFQLYLPDKEATDNNSAAMTESALTPLPPDDRSCRQVKIGDTGWTDNQSANAIASVLLLPLGYRVTYYDYDQKPIATLLSRGSLDFFLSYWSPSADSVFAEPINDKSFQMVRVNMTGAHYGLATTQEAYQAGLKKIKDIKKFKEALNSKIHGLEKNSPDNKLLTTLLADEKIEGIEVVANNEMALLKNLEQNQKETMVFLAWRPHWMGRYPIVYLSGGDKWFGKDNGYAEIKTLARNDLQNDCPNLYRLLQNLSFPTEVVEEIMYGIEREKKTPHVAVLRYINDNHAILDDWLKGVTSMKGEPAREVVFRHWGF